MTDHIIRVKPEDYAGIVVRNDHNFLLMTTPLTPKGQQKRYKRLCRIKRNLVRELRAYNKEMRRFPKEQPRD